MAVSIKQKLVGFTLKLLIGLPMACTLAGGAYFAWKGRQEEHRLQNIAISAGCFLLFVYGGIVCYFLKVYPNCLDIDIEDSNKPTVELRSFKHLDEARESAAANQMDRSTFGVPPFCQLNSCQPVVPSNNINDSVNGHELQTQIQHQHTSGGSSYGLT